MTKIKSVRGMNDITPKDIKVWQFLESSIRRTFSSYGYEEIRFPIVEETQLFDRSIGEMTDIVSKEMYSFEDKKGLDISLRPEGTAGCVRACIENNLLRTDLPRLWYMGPMFRYERPQKGRSRQFHQASLEAYGMSGPDIDAEIILVSQRLWKNLGIEKNLYLELNSLGNKKIREQYKSALRSFLETYRRDLDSDSLRKLESNPLRILDSKSEEIKIILSEAPKINEFLEKDALKHFNGLTKILDKLGVPYKLNTKLVRGIDYYDNTVFEWKTDKLGSQDAVCAGGRYNRLVEELGGNSCPAVGFSIGMERLVLLLQNSSSNSWRKSECVEVYFVCLSERCIADVLDYAEKIRKEIPHINLKVNLGLEKAKNQFKKADKSGARFALIVGEEELKQKTIILKDMRTNSPQNTYSLSQIIKKLKLFSFEGEG